MQKGLTLPPALFMPSGKRVKRLLDLGFLEFDVLAGHRVILAEQELFGLGARVLLGDIIIASVGSGHELDLDGGRLGHGSGSE